MKQIIFKTFVIVIFAITSSFNYETPIVYNGKNAKLDSDGRTTSYTFSEVTFTISEEKNRVTREEFDNVNSKKDQIIYTLTAKPSVKNGIIQYELVGSNGNNAILEVAPLLHELILHFDIARNLTFKKKIIWNLN